MAVSVSSLAQSANAVPDQDAWSPPWQHGTNNDAIERGFVDGIGNEFHLFAVIAF
jgi:hypothetical protein